MQTRELDPSNMAADEDWYGNNAAFKCPAEGCGRTFIVSGHLNRMNGRKCPHCGGSTGFVTGGAESGGRAWIEWDG